MAFLRTCESSRDHASRTFTIIVRLHDDAGFSQLYTLSGTGATLVGAIGGGATINGLAANVIPEPGSILLFSTGLMGLGWMIKRRTPM
jgi:hypothetical protein